MITVAVIGILTAVALPSYLDQIQKSRRSDAFDALLNCAAQQTRAYSNGSPPSYLTPTTAQNLDACGWDGTDFVSSGGNYTLAITNPGCTGGSSVWCYLITATAISGQADDSDCATLAIDHRGSKSAEDSSNQDSTDKCWKD